MVALIHFQTVVVRIRTHQPSKSGQNFEFSAPSGLARILFLHLDKKQDQFGLTGLRDPSKETFSMKNYQLGEFEEIVILTVGILNSAAYSVSIKNEIESRLKRGVSMGALHTALKRLEDKGYLK